MAAALAGGRAAAASGADQRANWNTVGRRDADGGHRSAIPRPRSSWSNSSATPARTAPISSARPTRALKLAYVAHGQGQRRGPPPGPRSGRPDRRRCWPIAAPPAKFLAQPRRLHAAARPSGSRRWRSADRGAAGALDERRRRRAAPRDRQRLRVLRDHGSGAATTAPQSTAAWPTRPRPRASPSSRDEGLGPARRRRHAELRRSTAWSCRDAHLGGARAAARRLPLKRRRALSMLSCGKPPRARFYRPQPSSSLRSLRARESVRCPAFAVSPSPLCAAPLALGLAACGSERRDAARRRRRAGRRGRRARRASSGPMSSPITPEGGWLARQSRCADQAGRVRLADLPGLRRLRDDRACSRCATNYVDSGRVSYELRSVPIHGAVDLRADPPARCGAQEAVHPLAEQVWAQPRRGARPDPGERRGASSRR